MKKKRITLAIELEYDSEAVKDEALNMSINHVLISEGGSLILNDGERKGNARWKFSSYMEERLAPKNE